jgi:rubrerythrin
MRRTLPLSLFLLLALVLAPACRDDNEDGLGPDGKPVPKALRPIDPVKSAPNSVEAWQHVENDKARFEAFAKKADDDGYARAAQLFRAAARSEEIAARNISNSVVSFGLEKDVQGFSPATPTVVSTPENLKAAWQETQLDSGTLFAGWLLSARKERKQETVKAFEKGKAAAVSLSKLLHQAEESPEDWRTAGDGFAVCVACGLVVDQLPQRECPSCKEPPEHFEIVR